MVQSGLLKKISQSIIFVVWAFNLETLRRVNKKNIGSSFDDFFDEEAILDETTAVAIKRVIAWQIDQEMKAQKLTKSAMAKKMYTSHFALNRLLDENDTSLTLTTLSRAASVLGKNAGLRSLSSES